MRCTGIAGDLLQKATTTNHFNSGFDDTDGEPISRSEIAHLKIEVAKALKGENNLHKVVGLLWALGKSGDKKFEETYRKFVTQHLR